MANRLLACLWTHINSTGQEDTKKKDKNTRQVRSIVCRTCIELGVDSLQDHGIRMLPVELWADREKERNWKKVRIYYRRAPIVGPIRTFCATKRKNTSPQRWVFSFNNLLPFLSVDCANRGKLDLYPISSPGGSINVDRAVSVGYAYRRLPESMANGIRMPLLNPTALLDPKPKILLTQWLRLEVDP